MTNKQIKAIENLFKGFKLKISHNGYYLFVNDYQQIRIDINREKVSFNFSASIHKIRILSDDILVKKNTKPIYGKRFLWPDADVKYKTIIGFGKENYE